MKAITSAITLVTLLCWGLTASAQVYLDAKQRGEFIAKVLGSNPSGWHVLSSTLDMWAAVRNDATHLYVHAIVWGDYDDSIGTAVARNKPIGDYSLLMVHFGRRDKRVRRDVDVMLNPWPEHQGIFLKTYDGAEIAGALEPSRAGVGSIQYVRSGQSAIRIDRYKVPLSELGLAPGGRFRTAFYAFSPAPQLTVNSAGPVEEDTHFSRNIPVSTFKEVVLKAK
jgi:hypothetical protein